MFPNQEQPPPPPPDLIKDEEQYEIEEILNSKSSKVRGRRGQPSKTVIHYFIKWVGWTREHNSWVHEIDMGNAKEAIADYEKKAKRRQGQVIREIVTKPRSPLAMVLDHEYTPDGDRVSGLFIWAATVAKFIHAFPAISRLEAVLAIDVPSDAIEALTTFYHTTLNTLVSEIPGTNVDIKTCVRNVLGAVLVAKTWDDESSRPDLELLGMTEDILDNIVLVDKGGPRSHHVVSMLGSILIPDTKCKPIQLIHKSLANFLQDRNRCGDEWFVEVTLHNRALAKQCLDVSKSYLQTLQKWSSNTDMDIGTIPVYISQYALLGVLWHVRAFDDSGLELASFFRHYFLLWLDVLLHIKSGGNVLSSLLMVLNWSNQFGNTESRTLFYHAYLFAYRASQNGGHSSSGPSYAMSLSPSSNVIRKAWEQLNESDSPVSSGKERLLCYMRLPNDDTSILLLDSDSLMTFDISTSVEITQYEINTGQQKSLPEKYHSQASLSDYWKSCRLPFGSFVASECSIFLMTYGLEMPLSTLDWIRLPLHNYLSLSQETPDEPLWYYIILFDS
ncbi:hypothetical protein EV421DRAFT_1906801 [Armillaria borealis]|uniref:Chromo domain-containing protein n=1 Tax=Armillaria borealis TaxID=47425 RepID=A0AA39JAL1_9AGAR|nr:hypothetical protein EV421DRAFT_1906801 [Armillaria borealis]